MANLLGEGCITHLLQFPMLSSSPELVYHSLDILCRCPRQQRASPPMDKDISTQTSVPAKAAQVLWEETNTEHAPVPWHSARRRQSIRVRDSGSSWLERKCVRDSFFHRRAKSGDKCLWTKYSHLLWFYHCRSCPPCHHQTLSEGKTRPHSSPAPFLPAAQHKAMKTSLCVTHLHLCAPLTLERFYNL